MTVKEYNKKLLPKVTTAKSFILCMDNLIAKIFNEDITDKEEMKKFLLEVFGIYGWSEETKQTILDALELYRVKEGIEQIER